MRDSCGFVALLLMSALALTLAVSAACAAELPDATGQWLGAIAVPGGDLRVLFHLAKGADGKYTATLDSLDQGVTGIPVREVAVEGEKLRLEMPDIGGRFEGTFAADRAKVTGTWTQGGQEFDLTLARTEKVPEPNRPQTPKKPYPYIEEEVTFEEKGVGTFAGTLTRPKGEGPFPAVLLITGSGPQDRDETLFEHKPFLVLADSLTRRGIAVLRVDDRGVGGSAGDPSKATTADYAGDAYAALRALRARQAVDPARVGLLGHSEGALIADLVASQHPSEVAFVVRIGGPGVTGEQVLLEQQRLISLADGAKQAAVDQMNAESKRFFAVVKKTPDQAEAGEQIRALLRESYDAMTPEQRKASGLTEEVLSKQGDMVVAQMTNAWFRHFLTYDPKPALAKLTMPVLSVWGEKDLQVPPAQNLAPVEAALKRAGNTYYTVKALPGLNHVLQTANTGSPREYLRIEETMSPTALQVIGDWIGEQVKK